MDKPIQIEKTWRQHGMVYLALSNGKMIAYKSNPDWPNARECLIYIYINPGQAGYARRIVAVADEPVPDFNTLNMRALSVYIKHIMK